jgi:catalase
MAKRGPNGRRKSAEATGRTSQAPATGQGGEIHQVAGGNAAKEEPDRGFPQAQTAHDNFWDFISLTPESLHMAMWIMSDRTIPRSLRFMEGFGVHTFRLVNGAGQSTFVKFHWKPKLGMQSVVWNEALKINGADPDFHRRDMWNAIQAGDFPEWELGLQLFDDEFAEKFDFDVLDATKIIPEEEVPVRRVGRLVLDRCVDNFFAETEQVAFCTQNIVPGVDFSNDPLLQGRNFSYLDTQLKRLGGPNFTFLPINAPKCPFHTLQQDGHMAMINPKGRANYEPNSWGGATGGPREAPEKGFRSFPAAEQGTKERVRSETFADHYSQARQFYIGQTEPEQAHIASAFTFELSKVQTVPIRSRMVGHLLNIDEDLANTVAAGLRLREMPVAAEAARPTRRDLKKSRALSILLNGPESFKGRKVGAVVTDGVDGTLLEALRTALHAEGAQLTIVAPMIGGVEAADGTWIEADEKIDGGPSVVFDAVALLVSEAGAEVLVNESTARDFVADAFAHLKFIAYVDAALPLMKRAGIDEEDIDDGFVELSSGKKAKMFVETCRKLRFWGRAAVVKQVWWAVENPP